MKPVMRGVPQGSVLGPDLWNIFNESLLRLEMPEGVELLAYADDVAIVSSASVPVLLGESMEEAFTVIERWMTEHGITLAAEKSEAIVITKRKVHNETNLNCAGHVIASFGSII